MDKENIILADCEEEELLDFKEGLEEVLNIKFKIQSKICNGKRSFFRNILRYFVYACFPIKFFVNRKKYEYIIGWQQFFTIFFIFYCNMFHVKKKNTVLVGNFTYKYKDGFIGLIYNKFMHYILASKYLDYIHVPSNNYAKKCMKQFGIPKEKFIVTYFGIPDNYEKWKDAKCEYDNFSLAIGRSNRDYDFLINEWKKMPKDEKLLIICDQLKSEDNLPNNIIIRRDIIGDNQFKYIINCKLMIIPIKDGEICSGDTVLLKAMSFYKPVIVTVPSTLAEMYIKNKENGICLEKKSQDFKNSLLEIIKNKDIMTKLRNNARLSFLENYSRKSMGERIGKLIMD